MGAPLEKGSEEDKELSFYVQGGKTREKCTPSRWLFGE